jgi:ABC-2 type transport system ATP-binding protein
LYLREQGATIIFSTHRMESVEELCERIALINEAQVVLEGDTHEIKRRYSTNSFLLKYEGDLPALDANFEVQQLPDAYLLKQALITIHKGGANELLHSIIGQVQIHALEEQIPSFNEIFIRTVQKKAS